MLIDEREYCAACRFFYGVSAPGELGFCLLNPTTVEKAAESCCGQFKRDVLWNDGLHKQFVDELSGATAAKLDGIARATEEAKAIKAAEAEKVIEKAPVKKTKKKGARKK